MRRWTIEELNREHPLPDGWAWTVLGSEVSARPAWQNHGPREVFVVSGDLCTTRAVMDIPVAVALAVILASTEHPVTCQDADALRSDLLAAREEVARLRARVRVEAADVERAGVTRAHIEAWLRANGWAPSGRVASGPYANWNPPVPEGGKREWVSVFERGANRATETIGDIARVVSRAPLDILDEMAALEVQT